MKKLLLLVVVVVSFLSFNAFAQTSKDSEAVKKTFQNFRTAVLNKDGALAAKQVDASTIKYYAKVLDWTWYADTTIIDSLNVLDRLAVLNLRHRVSKDRLLQLKDAKDLIKLSVDSGYFSEHSVKDFEIGNVAVKVKEGIAKGQARVNGKDISLFFKFIKEQDVWKLQLTETLMMAGKGMEQDIKRQEKNENEYIWTYLILESGKNVAPDIIEPLKKR
ncbi:MAG: hypothetical protein EOP54_09350 [Sphingobacteriales bacterium]|nr:MAG: hypothetical protein EOP54_09350 [Sphingobacteriales bacterium]